MTSGPLAPHHENLLHDLRRRGFAEVHDNIWRGEVEVEGMLHVVEISLAPETGYPVNPPAVRVIGDRGPTWHQNADGTLCLYANGDPGPFPWLATGDLVERVVGWLREAEAGWPSDDPPDVDLHRYWPACPHWDMIIHDVLDDVASGSWLRLGRARLDGRLLVHSGNQAPPRKRPGSHRHKYALVLAVGEVEVPPRTWADLARLLDDRDKIAGLVRDRRLDVVLIRFTRKSVPGILGLHLRSDGRDLLAEAIECAEHSAAVFDLRRGPHVRELTDRTVAVVGVGSVGSYVADGLHRAGIGGLTLVDPERLRPGNVTRHAAPGGTAGLPKVAASAAGFRPSRHTEVKLRTERLLSQQAADELVARHDVVVDATGNTVVSLLLREAARAIGSNVVVAYLSNGGRSLVVDVAPEHPEGEPQAMEPTGPDMVEAGCGEPVSPTPPHAVQEVAAMACRVVVRLLTTGSAEPELREYP